MPMNKVIVYHKAMLSTWVLSKVCIIIIYIIVTYVTDLFVKMKYELFIISIQGILQSIYPSTICCH